MAEMFEMVPINSSASNRRNSQPNVGSESGRVVPSGDPQATDILDFYEDIEVPGVDLRFDDEGNLRSAITAQPQRNYKTFHILDENAAKWNYSSRFSPRELTGPMARTNREPPVEVLPSCFTRFRQRLQRACSWYSFSEFMYDCCTSVSLDRDPAMDARFNPAERGEHIDQDYDLDMRNYQLSTGQRVNFNPVAPGDIGYQFDVIQEDEF